MILGANACVGSHEVDIFALVAREKECNCNEGDSARDESTEEQLQCKQQYICTPHEATSPSSPRNGHVAFAPNPCIESMHETTETEYAISEITNPQSYCGDDGTIPLITIHSHVGAHSFTPCPNTEDLLVSLL